MERVNPDESVPVTRGRAGAASERAAGEDRAGTTTDGTPATVSPAGAPAAPSAWWIEDDELLRDEGVVFGLAGVEELPESKIEAIRTYFCARIARSEADRRALLDERGRLERRAEALRERIGAGDGQTAGAAAAGERNPPAGAGADDGRAAGEGARAVANDGAGSSATAIPADAARGGLVRDAAGALLAAAVCVLAYFVVRNVLGDAFVQPRLVALGVTLAGMFVVFAPVSVLYSADERQGEWTWTPELWKVRLVEFGMPAVAAFFVVAWGESAGVLQDVAAFLFLGLLFLTGGRLLLGMLTRTGPQLRRYGRDRRRRRHERTAHAHVATLRDRADAIDRRLTTISEHLRAVPTAEQLEAVRDHKLALLSSEFELARTARARHAAAAIAPDRAREDRVPASDEGAA